MAALTHQCPKHADCDCPLGPCLAPDFNVFHPDFADWCDQVDADLYGDECSTAAVIAKLLGLGFTIIPPPMPRYAVTYNGVPRVRADSREEAERILGQILGTGRLVSPGWQIRDSGA